MAYTWTQGGVTRGWRAIASSSDGAKLVACVGGGQIYTSTDSGVTWTPRDSNRVWISVSSSSDGVKLVAVVNGGQIYTSTDSGATWIARDSNRSWYAVASSSDVVKLVAAVDGGRIYTSTDSGENWIARDSNRNWFAVSSSFDGVNLVATTNNGVAGGSVYVSSDSGVTWELSLSNGTKPFLSCASSSSGVNLITAGNGGYIYTGISAVITTIPETITFTAQTNFSLAVATAYHETISFTSQTNVEFNRQNGFHLALSYSPENQSVTTYSNIPFDSSCIFNGKTLFFSENGMFEYGGTTDNGAAIIPSLKTGKMDTVQGRNGLVHSNKIKRIPNAKIKVSCDKTGGKLDLNVTTDNDAVDSYEHAITHDGFATHDVKIGRGTKFNFIQLEIKADGCSKLDINNIEFDIVENVRSER